MWAEGCVCTQRKGIHFSQQVSGVELEKDMT